MITFYSRPESDFTDLYLAVREKENRLLTDAEVARLPETDDRNPHSREWKLRKKSAEKFVNYIHKKEKPLKILDIGCGNGWFSNLIATIPGVDVLAIDVNLQELEQADRLFKKPNLRFACADLVHDAPRENFDIAIFNSCFQYFKDAKQTLATVSGMLAEHGEIHLIDTPFYKINEVENARRRTNDYYENLGFPGMARHYFHHLFADLGKYKTAYAPNFFTKRIGGSKFYWIVIGK